MICPFAELLRTTICSVMEYKNSYQLLGDYYVPGTFLQIFHVLTHLMLAKLLRSR